MDISSYLGAGPLTFGMTREEVRAAMHEKPRSYLKSATSEFPTDTFVSGTVHAYYRAPGVLQAIEFYGPANPTFSGVSLVGKPFAEVQAWFESLDHALLLNPAGFTSKELGIGVYAPSAYKDPTDPVESVIAFEKGYYDR